MTYDINLNFYYQTFDVFKQKDAINLQGLFANGRILDYATFNGFGLINTVTKKADIIYVEESEKFNRSKTNCIIYDLTNNKWNPGKFDKLFIYKTTFSRDNSYYGFILYNTKTKKMSNIYNIDYANDILYQHIYRAIINLANDKMYAHYSKKYDAVQGRYGLTHIDCPNVTDFNEMKQYYEDFLKLPFFNKNN